LEHCKVPQRKGALIPFRLDKEQDSLFYLGNCSGPAGTSRLFYLLYRLTGKQQYLDTIYELVDGMEAVGAPEHQSAGLWYNLDFCCGHAGLLQFFASLYQATGEQRFSELVRRTASVLLGEKEETADGAAYWTIALERLHPEQLSQPRGYYLGAAGIAAALLQAYLLETDSFFWKRMIDDPFPEKLRSKEWRIS
jgi:lantibiotic modifying enzyme